MNRLYQNSRLILSSISLLIALVLSTMQAKGASGPSPAKVFVVSIQAEINPRMSLYVAKALKEAETQQATLLLIQMNTFGGALEDAEKIRDLFLNSTIPTWVYINRNAASAGALISLACDKIYMHDGSNIGAATVVDGEGEPAPDKYQAYMRSLMRSTAQANGRNPLLAEGMVGQPLAQDSSKIGHVISYTTDEAIAAGFCEGKVTGLPDILRLNAMTPSSMTYYEQGPIDDIVSFLLHPIIRALLMLLIIGGVYFELYSPGIGVPLAVAIGGLICYFIPSYLSGLAAHWEVLLFFLGVGLLALELLVIPGFGVTGVLGILCMFGSLVLVSVNNNFFDFTFVSKADLEQLFLLCGVSSCAFVGLALATGNRLVQSKRFKKITLQEQQLSSEGYTVATENHVGLQATAYTDLRPSGKILLNGKIYDAYTAGEYIEKDSSVVIKEQSLGSLKVKKVISGQ